MKMYNYGVPNTKISLSNFYAFSRASRALSLLFVKTIFMSSGAEKQHETKLSDAKRKFMELVMRKPCTFFLLVRIDDVTPS